MYGFFKELALPPSDFILILAAGVILLGMGRRRLGMAITVTGVVLLYLLSTPVVAALLLRTIEPSPVGESALANSGAQAIVVLSGGYQRYAPEYSGSTIDALTVQRLRYAAHLARRLNLPVLVSGGNPYGTNATLAGLMKDALEQDFGVPVRWVEDRSADTYENAQFSAALLKPDGVDRIILVTHAAHMRRAARMFSDAGLHVIPAPTVFSPPFRFSDAGYFPRISGLEDSYYALYEILGGAWYAIRH